MRCSPNHKASSFVTLAVLIVFQIGCAAVGVRARPNRGS